MCGEDEVTVSQLGCWGGVDWRLNQGCSLTKYLLNIYIADIVECIIKNNLHAPLVGKRTFSALLFANDVDISSFYCQWFVESNKAIAEYCSDWNVKWI
jgi:hypothetical protein